MPRLYTVVMQFVQACGGIGAISPRATRAWYSRQLIGFFFVFTSTMVMQPSTGQTSDHRLQPTHSSSLMRGTGRPGTRPGPRSTFSFLGSSSAMAWCAPSSHAM